MVTVDLTFSRTGTCRACSEKRWLDAAAAHPDGTVFPVTLDDGTHTWLHKECALALVGTVSDAHVLVRPAAAR